LIMRLTALALGCARTLIELGKHVVPLKVPLSGTVREGAGNFGATSACRTTIFPSSLGSEYSQAVERPMSALAQMSHLYGVLLLAASHPRLCENGRVG
jgi:hypothetical protein